MMRVVAIHILLVLLAIYFHLKGVPADTSINTDFILHNNSPDDISDLEFLKEPQRRLASRHGEHGGAQADNNNDDDIIRYNNGYIPDEKAYLKFLRELRERLASGNHAHDMAVLRSEADLTPQQRFIRVELENNGGDVVTILIDASNVYLVGFFSGNNLVPIFHYFTDCPEQALRLFDEPQYQHSPLGFSSNYLNLGEREDQDLGHGPLNDAIRNLYYSDTHSLRTALLVIIQMVSEAARIRYIEHRVRVSIRAGADNMFRPDVRMLTLENNWGSLSEQIQESGESGVFPRRVQIQDVSRGFFNITTVRGVMRNAALALLVYACNNNNNLLIKIPVPVAVVVDEQCPLFEPMTNIVGPGGLCLDVLNDNYQDGNPVQLWPCGYKKRAQMWTFKSDGTIRSNGKCLTRYEEKYNYSISIYDCDSVGIQFNRWIIPFPGTIMNVQTGRVLTADDLTQGSRLRAAEDINNTRQAWDAGIYTEPPINYIIGFGEMCLQGNGVNNRVWLANCVIGEEPRQQWAFYGDSTIRPYSDRSLCVTSRGHDISASIILLECQGWGNQRWTLMADGTILNPNARLVMDVRRSDVSLQEIILYSPTGNPNQEWFAF